MELISKLIYRARRQGLSIDNSDGVKLMNTITKKYVHILPNGKICSDDILGHDKALKNLMGEFLTKDPFIGSFICLPCTVTLCIGDGVSGEDVRFSKHCLEQCFENIKNFKVVKDENLLPSECMVKHEFVLSYKKRQVFIDACLSYLN